ncbi:HpcH/HpaI aldolase family protein [Frigidibacter sp. ROC022]|uniref:HpcH/HpaI aldolase family protein n=1 Tax=Frigidibacter sp. ROC022 TaxID=2971796 RepID=UPI00215A370A|nr:aldolase/citrate lyase family protein [Frigidibacter sp. ROC022]MCR8725493.1 aldolase/citrate lyase family protein [Frigidibacter sp. ROC022]
MKTANPMIRKMEAGATAIGIGTTLPAGAQVAMLAAKAGFDWAFIDLEHTLIGPEDVAIISNMMRAQDIAPVARIPKHALFDVARLLDSGACGIIRPHVETAEEARELVELCKYAPGGDRSWGGASPQLGYPQRPSPELMQAANRSTLAIIMIESGAGIDAIEEIAAVPGLDGVLIGCVDLSIDLGVMGQVDAPPMHAAIARIGRATKAAGKFFGMAGVAAPEALTRIPGIKVDFTLAGLDSRLLAATLEDRATVWRQALGGAG